MPQTRRVGALRERLGGRLGDGLLAEVLTEGSRLGLDDAVRQALNALTAHPSG